MTHKRVLFKFEAREKLLRGATQLADAIRVTLGPKSKSVLIQKSWGVPIVCNDGVTIAKEFDLDDPEENLGARVLRQAAEKTGEVVGDGTSTATVLARAILREGGRNVAAGASAVEIKRGLDRGVKLAVNRLREIARPVSTRKEKIQVAAISAHNDAEIGRGKRRPERLHRRFLSDAVVGRTGAGSRNGRRELRALIGRLLPRAKRRG